MSSKFIETSYIKNRLLGFIGGTLILASLIAWGDGGGGKSDSGSSTTTAKPPAISLATPAGTLCASNFNNADAFGNINFQSSTGTTPWGCLVVEQAANQPTVSGTKSVRVELRPGDCDSSQTALDKECRMELEPIEPRELMRMALRTTRLL